MSGGQVLCGLKLTHDGAAAVIDGGRLVFSVEAEKLENRARHSHLSDLADVSRLLATYDVDPASVDAVSVDGWVQSRGGAPGVEVTREYGGRQWLDLAGYLVPGTPDEPGDAFASLSGTGFPLAGREVGYVSYTHATDHAMASYCTSPSAARGESALILVWDGGMPATLFRFDAARRSLQTLGTVLDVAGSLYPVFASHFAPFRVSAEQRRTAGRLGDFGQLESMLPISGKAMAYASLDKPSAEAMALMNGVSDGMPGVGVTGGFIWSQQVLRAVEPLGLSDATVLASFQQHLLERLIHGLRTGPAAGFAARGEALCLSGGCALNIKWNSALRATGLFSDVWVPPFPNDAGSAIGAACTELVRRGGDPALEWTVFAGPAVVPSEELPAGWSSRPCSATELGELLHREGDPIVVLAGRAELGPRALGHRSILAPATDPGMKDRLNRIKLREGYRPVAPICLEQAGPQVFEPGTPDPYMLFEHMVRPDWLDRVPAIVHADGSARLQTVAPDNSVLHEILAAYERASGVPVLCNTSANLPGSGFFPDVVSAAKWGGVERIWSDGTLYSSSPEAG